MEIEISKIKKKYRHRRDLGNIQPLAESIKNLGLLQPIGITKDNCLVFGERRVEAFKYLNRDSIPCRVIDIQDIVLGEHDENEVRKDFTASERVAIGKTIEQQIGKGHGGDRRSENFQSHNGDIENKRTDEVVAKKAGFDSRRSYRDAKTVVDKGASELIEAMDNKKVSISTAAVIATEPKEEQKVIVELSEKEILAKAGKIRQKRKDERRQKQVKKEKEALKTININEKKMDLYND